MTIKLKLLLAFGGIILMSMIGLMIYDSVSVEVLKNSEYLRSSETAIRNSNSLHKQVIAMQSGFRGFLLTGQESFLEPYNSGLKLIPGLLEEQKNLTSSDEQIHRLEKIKNLHYRWVTYASSLIKTRHDTTAAGKETYEQLFEKELKTGVGKRLNDSLQIEFRAFDAFEYNVRHKRQAMLSDSVKDSKTITFSLAAVSIVAALAFGFFISKGIVKRIDRMVSFAEEIARGNFIQIKHRNKDELTSLSNSLNTMSVTLEKTISDLKQKNKDLDQFAYVVSHDLKAPLRGIDNIVKWIYEDHNASLTPELKEYLTLIEGRTKRLERLIDGLLEYARIGRTRLFYEKVNTLELVNEVIETLVPKDYFVAIKSDMPTVYAQRLRLSQVFSNLVSNAVKYNNPGGHIFISAKEQGHFYEFSVTDDGPGIDSIHHDKIFEIFQTLKEKDAFESTGVGLAIVKKIIEEQKGTIKVISEPGKGATFSFTWPKEPQTEN